MSVLAAVSLLVLYIPAAASADNSSVSLICESGSKAVADMHWSIYRIGERIDNEFVLTGDFAEYPVDLTDLSEENIGIVAKSLERPTGIGLSNVTAIICNSFGWYVCC